MSVFQLIKQVKAQGIVLSLHDGKLKVSGNKQALDGAMLAQLKDNKAELLDYLGSMQTSKNLQQIEALDEQSRSGRLPLSYNQRRLWFISQMQADSALYNGAVCLNITGKVDVNRMEQSLWQLVQRHESLRTVYGSTAGEPWQQRLDGAEFSMSYTNLTDAAQPQQQMQRLIEQSGAQSFALDTDIMLRAHLITVSATEHCLVLVTHHIASDAWSQSLMLKDFVALYENNDEKHDEQQPLAQLPLQYADYVAWEQKWLQGEVLENKLHFWLQYLADPPQMHELPMDRVRPAQPSFAGSVVKRQLPAQLVQQVNEVAHSFNTTVFVLLQTVYASLIARISNSNDIVMGTPVANRTLGQTQQISGFFSNTVVLRNQIDADVEFGTLLTQNSQRLKSVFEHQDVPFDLLVDKLGVERSLASNPLYQIWFSLHEQREQSLTFADLQASIVPDQKEMSRYDLKLEALVDDNSMVLNWAYSTELFDGARIEAMADYFETMLAGVLTMPSSKVWQLPMHNHKQAGSVALTQEAYPTCRVEALFAQAVKQNPDWLAMVQGDNTFSFAQLDCQSNRLAALLQEQDVGVGSRVGLCSERSIEALIGLLAILKSGAAYVPMDPEFPTARLKYMIEDGDISLVLLSHDALSSFPVEDLEVLMLDGALEADWLVDYDDEIIESDHHQSTDVAYVIYTSGSTGQPKGVQVSHQNLVHYLSQLNHRYPFAKGMNYALTSTMATDLGNTILFSALVHSGSLHILDKSQIMDGHAIANYFSEHQIDVAKFTPSHFSTLADDIVVEGLLPRNMLFIGGENFSVALLDIIRSHHQGHDCRVINHYGPTELTIGCLTHEIDFARHYNQVPVGSALNNLQAMVLQGEQPVPVGVKGELVVAGPAVTLGYLHPTAKASSFAQLEIDGQTLAVYRTGDIVIGNECGELFYQGRADGQLKIRGYRVEVGEIEHTILSLDGVTQTAVTIDDQGEPMLLAYVCGSADVNTISSQLRDCLPAHMLPHHIIQLETLPLTANGKLDRSALPKVADEQQHAFVEPTTQTQVQLIEIYQQLLGHEQISANGDFFALGGHSLLSTRLLYRIRSLFAVALSIADIFANPKVDELAAIIDAKAAKDSPLVQTNKIERQPETTDVLLSFSQQRLWFIDRLEGGSSQYNMPIALQIDGDFSVELAQQALSQIIDRHQVLRTTFHEQNEGPVGKVNNDVTFTLNITDLSSLDKHTQQTKVSQLITADASWAFDLSKDLMLRGQYIKTHDDTGVLVLNIHHIASDGWSLNNLLTEFTALYSALEQQTDASLAELPVQYSDYAKWQQLSLSNSLSDSLSDDSNGGHLQQQTDYWMEQLADIPVVHSLPLDYARPAKTCFEGEKQELIIDSSLLASLNALADSTDTTLFMVLHACFAGLLSQFGGQQQVVIGTAVANRLSPDVESLIGMFINTLVLNTKHQSGQSFANLLANVRDVDLAAMANQEVPFDYLVERLNPVRSNSYSPLCQIMLSMSNYEQTEDISQLGQANIKLLEQQQVFAKFDLLLNARPCEQGLKLTFQYSKALFNASTITTLANSLMCLLQGVATDSNASIAHWLSTEHLLPQTSSAQPQGLIHQRFSAQAKQTPNAVAVELNDQCLSYGQLEQQANQLAHYLIKQGVEVGSTVGLATGRSIEMMVAMLAILKAGGTYVPLDPSYPKERLSHMVSDAQIGYLITESSLRTQFDSATLDSAQLQLICVDTLASQLSTFATQAPDVSLSSSDLAYIIYTSGSTGLPKGVMVPHQGVMRLVCDLVADNDFMTLNAKTRFLQAASVSFDAATLELWGPLLNGGCCVLYPQTHIDLNDLNEVIVNHQVNAMWLTAGLFDLWSQAELDLPSLDFVLAGGDVVNPQAVARVQQQLPDVTLINGYGPTENTTFSCCYVINSEKANESDNESIPIGYSIKGTDVYVLSDELTPLPKGFVGELYLGGDGLAKGYLNLPQMTEQKFIANPFGAGRLYKTGDLVRYLDNGALSFMGRLDNQVKIRGFRVELGEIEQQLNQLAQVQSSLVRVHSNSLGDKQLVAYVISACDTLDTDKLLSSLADKLASHMMPALIMSIPQWPLTQNGKIDTNALPEPTWVTDGQHYVAPATKIELGLADIWSRLLDIDAKKISASDNFFTIGGHSLLAVRLTSEVRAWLDIELAISNVFETPNLQGLAQIIEQKETTASSPVSKLPAIKAAGRSTDLPLSFAQQRLWFIDQVEGRSSQYNMPCAFALEGDINFASLQQTFDALLQRHEVLRTSYHQQGEQTVQIINQVDDLPIVQHDLSENPQQLNSLLSDEAGYCFDLKGNTMIRVSLIKTAEQQHTLMINIHHIACDGWSVGVLVKEMQALYHAFCTQMPNPLVQPELGYADFSIWQQRCLTTDVVEQQKSYWQQRLAGIPVLHELPVDRPRPAQLTTNGGDFTQLINQQQLNDLKQLAQSQGATLFMLLNALYAMTMSRWSRQDDIVVGTPMAGRKDKALDQMVGCFVNTLALRTEVNQTLSFNDFLAQVRTDMLNDFEHQDLPFDHLVEALNPPRSASHLPIFQLWLVLQNMEQQTFGLTDLIASPVALTDTKAKFDLMLSATETDSGLSLHWVYNSDLFDSQTIVAIADSMLNLAREVVAQPQLPLSQYGLLSDAGKQAVLSHYDDSVVLEGKGTVIANIVAMAAKHPQRIAARFGTQTLTFGQLEQQSDRLAGLLAEIGVEPHDKVGVSTERGLEPLISMVAIGKVGGVFVPLDYKAPLERISYIVEDAAIETILAYGEQMALLSQTQADVVVMDNAASDSDWLADQSWQAGVLSTQADLAYVLYTSGTTGKPKGVKVSHGNLVSLADSLHQYIQAQGLSAPYRWGWNAPLTFDAALQAFSQLGFGCELVLIDEDTRMDPAQFVAMITVEKVDLLDCTPGIAELLLNEAKLTGQLLPAMIVGGEAINETLWQQLAHHGRQDNRFVINAYGPTETTVDATCALVTSDSSSHIGQPLSNTKVHILDPNGQLVPMGMAGECCIEGSAVSQGYLNMDSMSAQKFVEVQLTHGRTAKLYRSGDLVKRRKDGNLSYLGRMDQQLKLRGYRIELEEIEQLIGADESVSQVVVTVKQEQLIAYLVAASGQSPQAKAIEAVLKRQLPEYMLPNHYVIVDSIAVTGNGKVDYKALPSIDASDKQQYIAPRTTTEQQLEQIWCQLLGYEQISVDSNFFVLGGHSLLAIRLISAVRVQFDCELSLKALFEQPSIEALALCIERKEHQTPQNVITKAPEDVLIPLSYSQQRLWLLDQMDSGSTHYNIPSVYYLNGDVNIDAIEQALFSIVQRHESLRTVVLDTDKGAFQQVNDIDSLNVRVTDLSELNTQQADKDMRAMVREDALQPFDLTTDMMLRCQLVKLGENRHVLMFNMHHIATDGWSVGILVKEFCTIYAALVSGEVVSGDEVALPELPVNYRDYAWWQQNSGQAHLSESLDYWQQQLKGVPQVHSLPLDLPRPARQGYQGAIIERHLSAETLSRLQAFSNEHNVTLFMTLQATLAVLMARWSNEQDIVIGTPVAGRSDQALEPMIGFFLNTLALRNDVTDNPRFSDFLAATKQMVLSAFEYQDYPFELLVENINCERSASHLPIFQVMFVLQNQQQQDFSLPGLELVPAERDVVVSKFDLLLNAIEVDGQLALSWDYNVGLFTGDTVARMADAYLCLIEHMLGKPADRVESMNLVPEQARQTMLFDWNATAMPFPQDKLMHQLFIDQVAIRPHTIAVVDSDGELTYGQLYRQTLALHERIVKHQFAVESLIGVCLPKGRQQVIATLAIMMAGCAYLPLDTNWPAQRCDQVLAHAQAVMVIGSEASFSQFSIQLPQLSAIQTIDPVLDVVAHAQSFKCVQQGGDLAYVIFTSGSTGKPKGVAIEHRSVVNTLFDINQRFDVNENDSVLAVSALNFDLSVYDLFGLLAVGGKVVFPDDVLQKDPAHWMRLVQQHDITLWDSVPASAELLTREFEVGGVAQPSIRVVMMSGDWIPPTVPKRITQMFPNSKVISLGGATEGSIWSIMYPIESDTSKLKSVPYGKPMANQSFYVLSKDLQPCPVGVAGELHIGGVGVARCYYNDPERSQLSYIHHPQLNEKMYKTGDLGRYLPDGNIEFIGRIDHQVKIRGFRIELGEIEAVLNDHQGINSAVVSVLKDPGNVQHLVAYVVVDEQYQNIANNQVQVRNYLASKLPNYMVPNKFMVLDKLPLSANGKVDRKQLPEPVWQEQNSHYLPPSTETEKLLANVWQQILERENISVDQNLFEAGSSSLHMIKAKSKVNELLGTDFNVVSFFEHSTIQSMASFISEQQSQNESQNETQPKASKAKKPKAVNRFAARRKQRNTKGEMA